MFVIFYKRTGQVRFFISLHLLYYLGRHTGQILFRLLQKEASPSRACHQLTGSVLKPF